MKGLFIIIFIIYSIKISGQSIDYNKIILPNNSANIELAEKLVQLAWRNHPNNKSVRESVEISRLNYKLSKRQWMQNLRFGANLNEFNIDESRDLTNRSQFFPRYNFSLTFPLGDLFMDPLENKQSKIDIDLSENEVNATKLMVRRDVLQAYNEYVLHDEIYKIQRLAMDNAETNHSLVEENFEQGEETYERYDLSINNLNQRKITLLQSESNLKNAKLNLEEFIGVPLESVN